MDSGRGQSLPPIESKFETCEAYLIHILTNHDAELTNEDWDFVLAEIVQTLPGKAFLAYFWIFFLVPTSLYIVRFQLIDFTMANYDRKPERRRKSMHRSITRY